MLALLEQQKQEHEVTIKSKMQELSSTRLKLDDMEKTKVCYPICDWYNLCIRDTYYRVSLFLVFQIYCFLRLPYIIMLSLGAFCTLAGI